MFARIGNVHVVRERRMQASAYDTARYAASAERPHVYDAAALALAAPPGQPQTIVCLGPGAADVGDALCAFVARDSPLWATVAHVFAVLCPCGPERVVFTLDVLTNSVLGVYWGAPLPPYDADALVSFMDAHLPDRLRGQLGMARRPDEPTSPAYVEFMARLAELGVRDEALLWRAVRAIQCLRGAEPTDAAPLLGLEAPVVRRNAAALAALIHRRLVDWVVQHTHNSSKQAHGAVRLVTVWAEQPIGGPPSFEQLCRATTSDVLHAALDASFVAADRDERAADGCERGTAAPGRFSCDVVTTRLCPALRDAPDAAALVAAVGATLELAHARGAMRYDDVADWFECNRNTGGGAAQQLLAGSLLRPIMMPSRAAVRRGSFVHLASPGRESASIFGMRIDMAAADLNGAVGLHWVCCADPLTVVRLQMLQQAAGALHVRIEHAAFVREFRCAAPTVARTPAAILAATIGRHGASRVGLLRYVWLTTPALDCLRSIVAGRRTAAATRVQAWWRGIRLQRRFVRVRAAAVCVQRRRRRRAVVPRHPRELLMLRAIVQHTFALEYRWDCRHGDGVTAYAGLTAAMAAAVRAPALAERRTRNMAATGAVVLRLMRYAGFMRPAYDALRCANWYSVATLEALALVAAADPGGDAALLARLWAVGVRVVARRIVDVEWPVLRAAVAVPTSAPACDAGLAAWARLDDAIGTSIVRSGLLAAVYADVDERCVAHTAAVRGLDAERALAAAAWLAASGAALPRWRAALELCMVDDKAALAETAREQLTAAELHAIARVTVAPGGGAPAAVIALPAVGATAVTHAYAIDVAFY